MKTIDIRLSKGTIATGHEAFTRQALERYRSAVAAAAERLYPGAEVSVGWSGTILDLRVVSTPDGPDYDAEETLGEVIASCWQEWCEGLDGANDVVDLDRVRALRAEAAALGDAATVVDCDVALGGDDDALWRCAETISDAIDAVTDSTIPDDPPCPRCGQQPARVTCDRCGVSARLTDCGHMHQPRPIAADGHHTYCDDCAEADSDG